MCICAARLATRGHVILVFFVLGCARGYKKYIFLVRKKIIL